MFNYSTISHASSSYRSALPTISSSTRGQTLDSVPLKFSTGWRNFPRLTLEAPANNLHQTSLTAGTDLTNHNWQLLYGSRSSYWPFVLGQATRTELRLEGGRKTCFKFVMKSTEECIYEAHSLPTCKGLPLMLDRLLVLEEFEIPGYFASWSFAQLRYKAA